MGNVTGSAIKFRVPFERREREFEMTKHYFVELLVTAWAGAVVDARNLSGAITFDGNGNYTFTGKLGAGSGASAASTGSGTSSVTSPGSVTLSNPIQSTLQLNARLSMGSVVLLGASTEGPRTPTTSSWRSRRPRQASQTPC